MKHEQVKMIRTGQHRYPFKNHLVRKSYWVNSYSCPVCNNMATALNNVVAHKNLMCDGQKIIYVKRQ